MKGYALIFLMMSATTAFSQPVQTYYVNGQETYQGVPVYPSAQDDHGGDPDFVALPKPEDVGRNRHQVSSRDSDLDVIFGSNTSAPAYTKCGWAEVAMKTPDGNEFHEANWVCFNGQNWVRVSK
jgi:hypothetical protein